MKTLSVDFETYSDVVLVKHGLYRYVASPNFDIICASYSLDGGKTIATWWPGTPLPEAFHSARRINAWNAAFERVVWHSAAAARYGFRPRPVQDFRCTAARSRAFGAPGKLELSARFFNLPLNKDPIGQSVLKSFWGPRSDGSRGVPGAQDRAAIQRYCETDVRVECALSDILPELSDAEHKVYVLNEEINDRGIEVDMPFVRAAAGSALSGDVAFGAQLSRMTLGEVTGVKQTARILAWLKDLGTEIDALDEESVADALDEPDLHPLAARILRIRQDGAFAAISKYQAIINRVSADGRLRGGFVYCGAANTGRFASFGVQIHNLRRDVPSNLEDIVVRARQSHATYAELAACVRGSFIGNLKIGDYSQIEARVLPWLAQRNSSERLAAFARGDDLYLRAASAVYVIPESEVTPEQRQTGKVADLALGFEGGKRALQSMGRNYGLTFTDAQAESIKLAWRAANPWAGLFWKSLTHAVWSAISGQAHTSAGRVRFEYAGDILAMHLPSGRSLIYHGIQIEEGRYGPQVTCLRANRRPAAGAPWPRRALYGGLLAENATQAVARDILAAAMVGTSHAVAHVHDELVTDGAVSDLGSIMLESRPAWAEDLPLAVKVSAARRYGKS